MMTIYSCATEEASEACDREPLDLCGGQIGLNDLPNELLMHIFALLDSESVLEVACVCPRWEQLAMTPHVWDNMRLTICMKNYIKMSERILPYVSKLLKHVKLQYFKLYSHVRVPLTNYCPSLTNLEISISQVDSLIFEDLCSWPHLRYLSFRNSLITQDPEIENRNDVYHLPFDILRRLQTIILSNFALTPSSLDSMLDCRHLVSINMEKMKNIPSTFLRRLVLSKQHSLEALYVYGDTLNDDIMRCIAKCKRLNVLHIMTCKTLFDSSLLWLRSLGAIKSLKLRHGYFSTSALLAYLASNVFQRLTYLSLSRCVHVTMQVAQAIRVSAPNLKELSFYLCPFIMSPDFDRSELEKLFNIQLLLD